MTQYVASTLAAPVQYTGWRDGGNDVPQIEHSVTIAGGAGVANKHFVTPHGVVTPVEDSDIPFLLNNEVFKMHKENGYVTILESKPADADTVAADMNGADPSAPLTEADYENAPLKAPTTGTTQRKR